MGKKRRLMAKAKFKAKHSRHPRMIFLNAQNAVEEVEETVSPVESVIETQPAVEVPVVEEIPLPKPKTTTRKKRAPKKSTTRRTRTKKKTPKEATV